MKINFISSKKTQLFLLLACLVLILFIARNSIFNFNRSSLTANVSNSNPKMEDLGVQFEQLGSGGGSMFFDANGDPHWFVVYSNRVQFIDVNLKTGEKRYFNTGKSGLGSYTKALSGNKLFISVGDTCSLWEYDISAGNIRELKQAGSNNGCGNSTGGQSSYTAPDGMVYIGTAHRSTVIEIDPTTGNIRDFGIIDPPTGNPTCNGCPSRQVSTIVADANYVYAGMRDTGTDSWWLAIINRTDGSLSASCWKDDFVNSARVSASDDGKEVWYSTNSGYYRLDTTNGACPTTPARPPSLKQWFFPSKVYFTDGDSYAKAASDFGVDIDATGIDVDTSTAGIATLKYRNPAGSGSWVEKTQSILMKDAQIKRIKAKDDKSAYLVSGTYGPNSLFDGNSSKVLGRTPQSTYAITPLGQYVYISGYTSNTLRYTPALPWKDTGTFCNVSSPSNPCTAFQGMGKYHYYSVAASNGQLYIASTYKRGARAGGDIGWINPITSKTGSVALSCDSPSGFALLSDGTTLAYASEADGGSFGCTNTVGKLFLFDTKTNKVTNSFTPIAGSAEQGAVIGTNDGGILGIAKDFPSTGLYTMYKVDANGTHASWSPVELRGNIFGGSGQADRALVKAPDGMVYTWDSVGVVQINPNDGTVNPYVSSPSYITAMEFVGNDLYLATNPDSTKLKRIRDVSSLVNNLSADKSISSFNLNSLSPSVTGSVNNTNRTISLTVPYGTNVSSLIPTIAITGTSISPKTGVATNFTKPVTYTVTAEDSSTQSYVVTVNVAAKAPALSTTKSISSFNLNSLSPSVTGSVNNTNRTISLTVPYGTNVSSLIPTIAITGTSISPKTGVATNFTKPVTYTVTAEDSSTQSYVVTVNVAAKAPALSTTKSISSFNLNSLSPSVTGSVNNTNRTISLTVPYGTNVSSLIPTIAITGTSISPKTGVATNFTKPVTYTVTAEDSSTQSYVVTVNVAAKAPALSTTKSISSFNLNSLSPSVTGSVNNTNRTISLTVPYGTNVSSLIPTIAITGTSISPKTGVATNFTKPVTYTVTAEDSSTQSYVVTVKINPKQTQETIPELKKPVIPEVKKTEQPVVPVVKTPVIPETKKPIIPTVKTPVVKEVKNPIVTPETKKPVVPEVKKTDTPIISEIKETETPKASSSSTRSETRQSIIENFIESYASAIIPLANPEAKPEDTSSSKVEYYFNEVQSLPSQPMQIIRSLLLSLFLQK
jgi:hypothetical protein